MLSQSVGEVVCPDGFFVTYTPTLYYLKRAIRRLMPSDEMRFSS
nr:MAG TPA: hypothetical protein [Caudoviricetes sp.]